MKKVDLFHYKNVLDKISVYLAWVGVGILLVGALYTVVSVSLRYIIGIPLPGDVEIPSALLPVAVACFFTLTNVQKKHIRATLLVRRFTARRQAFLEGVYSFVAVLLLTVVTWQVVMHGLVSLRRGLVTDVVKLPLAPFEFLFALGIAILTLHLLIEGISLVKMSTSNSD